MGGEPRGDALPLARIEPQTQLRSPPQRIVGRPGPFVITHILQFSLVEPGSDFLAKIPERFRIGQDALGPGPVSATQSPDHFRRGEGVARGLLPAEGLEVHPVDVAAGQC